MKQKIKEFFAFLKSAWSSGHQGKIGIILLLLSIFFFVRLFCGEVSIQRFVVNVWLLNNKKTELALAKEDLQYKQHQVYMLKHPNTYPDYIEELGLKRLNLGNPKFKELKYPKTNSNI